MTTTLDKTTTLDERRRATAPRPDAPAQTPAPAPRARRSVPDTMAVWSFVLGLLGLLIFNLVLGPIALALATLALTRGTTRKGRAVFGLALGAADLVVIFALMATDHTISWAMGG
ncbi:hypothetical protein ACH4UT_23880 [Streptomyces sp. NPDC020799]|uniref:hypothetical protein n=1 Tax=unclassified Streptomyces TaxID=2593676 RepID=UPI0033CCA9CC